MAKFSIFQDMDGCLADFDKRAIEILGETPNNVPDPKMWKTLFRVPDFFTDLPWCADGRQLWELVLPHDPVVLTGVPHGEWAAPQKRAWVDRELGHDTPMIACTAKEKAKYAMQHLDRDSLQGCILIDDRPKHEHIWQMHGGIFVVHRNFKETKRKLRELGAIA